MKNINRRLSIVVMMQITGIFWILAVCGCTSSPFTRGQYVGGGQTSAEAQRTQAAYAPSTSAPLFASRGVREDTQNRASMERYTGRPVLARPATTDDVLAWHQSRVPADQIMTHIRNHGMSRPLNSQDELTLNQRGVPTSVIRTMHEHPYPKSDAPIPRNENLGPAQPQTPRVIRTTSSEPGVHGKTFAEAPPAPSVAQPVSSSGDGRPRMRISDVSPAWGGDASGSLPDGGVYIDDGSPYMIQEGGCCECY